MTELICLFVGIAIGGLFGVTAMCLLQINNLNHYHEHREENDIEKKY